MLFYINSQGKDAHQFGADQCIAIHLQEVQHQIGCCDTEKTIFNIDIEKILMISSISIFAVVLSQDDIIYVDVFWNIYDNIKKYRDFTITY